MISRLRQAVRSLARSPGFAVTAVLTVAIAIGINAAIFSILRAVVLSPLPYRDPGRVVAAWEVLEGEGHPWRVSPRTFLAWRERSHVFSGLAAFGGSRATLTGAGDPVALQGSRVSDAYFDVLGVAPRLGRTFRPDDIVQGAAPVVLIAESLWRTRFGSDPAVLGRSLLLDGKPKTVIGVMPSLFLPLAATATTTIEFGSDAAFWTPSDLTAAAARRGRSYVLGVVGRLSPGVDRARAEREMTALQQALRKEDGGNRAIGARLRSLTDEAQGAVRPALLLVWAAVLLVLLIACVNVSNLHFARSETRRRELAIRAALGGSRPRLVAQLLVESLVLALAGGVLGVLIAFWTLPLLLRLVPAGLPRLSDVSLSGGTVAFGLLLSVAAGILFGLAPAIHLTHAGLEEDLRSATRSGSQSKRSRRALAGMVIAEITLASMLVVGAGLLTRSFGRLTGVDLGFRSSRVLVLPVPIPQSTYDRWQKVASYQDALLSRLRAEPGVVSAALAYNHPLEAQWSAIPEIVGRPAPTGEPEHSVWFRSISEGYFRTLGVPLRQGRDFDVRDDAAHPGVAIVNETFARREFAGQSPIGRRLHSASASWTWGQGQNLPEEFEIVGVAADVRFLGPGKAAEPAFYLPVRQFPLPDMKLLVATGGDPLAAMPAVRRILRGIDPGQPIAEPTTVRALADESVASPRFAMRLMLGFSLAGLALAALGIYGLLSFIVTLRTREIGVRMALGARAGQVVRMVLADVLPLAAGGAVIGVAAALFAGPVLRGLLFGISPADPVSLVAAPVALSLVALAASCLPARRASRVDPMVSLRNE